MVKVSRWESMTWTGSGAGRHNEDHACGSLEAGCAVLVDGATGLTNTQVVREGSDAAWYARNLAEGVLARFASGCEGERDLRQALAEAGRDVAERYLQMAGARGLKRIDLPNGSFSQLAVVGERLYVVMLGDCTAMVLLRDGTVRVIHDATLDALDARNYELMYAYAMEHGVGMAQARQDLNDAFIQNRLLMNEPGGYWAADIGCGGFGHETVEAFWLAQVRAAMVCSDGFAAAVQMGVVASEEELARRVLGGEGEAVGEELREAELADAGCLLHHRSKTSDDATYALMSF